MPEDFTCQCGNSIDQRVNIFIKFIPAKILSEAGEADQETYKEKKNALKQN